MKFDAYDVLDFIYMIIHDTVNKSDLDKYQQIKEVIAVYVEED